MSNLKAQVGRIISQAKDFNAAAQKVCAALRDAVAHFNWVGVYMIEGGDTLALRAWVGPAATEHVRIPIGEGICGLAAREKQTVVVDDVTKDPRYLQCFLGTKSEIVVPIFARGEVVGEIDIDSDTPAAFTREDRELLEWCASKLAEAL